MSAVEPMPTKARAPLAVDLDGTLIRGDLFMEGMLRLGFGRPLRVFALLGWLTRGRAYAKARVAEHAPCDPATLPYDQRVLAWLQEERAAGRTIVLASASDETMVRAVADHVGVFDGALGSDGRTNLKSARKAERLASLFPDGFVYAGNESADLAVWRAASGAVLVNAAEGLSRRAARDFAVERTFPREASGVRAFVKAIRPQQWSKNLLVFLPMLAGQGWTQLEAWSLAFVAFWALSLTASGVYLINDASDIESDRRHPRKRRRPFASGALSPAWGLAAAALLIASGLALANAANVLPLALLYLAATTAYSFWLKRVALIDVFLLAGLYTIRIVLGGVATGYFASDWLLAFSCFFFLSLALVKRVAETRDLARRGGGEVGGRGYTATDTEILTTMGVSSSFIAALVLALYLQDDAIAANYGEPFLLWGLPAAGVLWTCRIWMKASRGEMHDDPIVFAARDKWSWAVAAFAGACFAGAVMAPANLIPGP